MLYISLATVLLSSLHTLNQMALPNWMTLPSLVCRGDKKHAEEDEGIGTFQGFHTETVLFQNEFIEFTKSSNRQLVIVVLRYLISWPSSVAPALKFLVNIGNKKHVVC